MNALFLSLGGNMGNRAALLNQALELISSKIGPVEYQSSVYETEAWGHSSKRGYYNMVVQVNTILSAEEVLQICFNIERQLGRTRSGGGYHDRTMDIDIIFYNTMISKNPDLTVPHSRFHLRKFVLVPMHEIAPLYIDPLSMQTITQLLENCKDTSTIVKIGSLN
jgi:2-amino-4-hydroxy-6-hydroxymethyldihydropteridine diphosphokinase